MSRFTKWIEAMFGRTPTHTDETRVVLSRTQLAQATRLSKLTGKTRDEVLREAYRKADRILAGEQTARRR